MAAKSSPLRPTTPLPENVSAETTPEWTDALSIARENRTELRQQRQQIKAAELRYMQADSEKTLADYEAQLAQARAAAQSVLAEKAAGSAAEAERQGAKIAERLNQEANEAAARISASQAQALNEVRSVAAELAAEAATKLIGVAVSPEDAIGAVDRAFGGEA